MQGARGLEGPEAGVRRLAAIAPRPGCDLQRPQGEGVRGAGGGDAAIEENATKLITRVEVTPSSGSDTDVSVPESLTGSRSGSIRPDELFADTAYGTGRNAFEASRRGTRTKERVTDHRRSPPRTFRSTSQGSRPRCAPPATRPSRSTS